MNDLAFLEDYLAEQPETLEETKNNVIDLFPDNPIKDTDSPVSFSPGKAADVIDQAKNEKGFMDNASMAKKKTEKVLGAAVPSLDDFPVPTGGIGLLVFIAVLVVFAITPVSGQKGETRLQLVWGAILGNYSMKTSGVVNGQAEPGATTPIPAPAAMPSYIQGGFY